ncbi:MAG TPA: hypothetical protein PLV85_19565 [Polyangiaceae bacterium]|nr:hypothetical protein [Polyangiaceae bacterium]
MGNLALFTPIVSVIGFGLLSVACGGEGESRFGASVDSQFVVPDSLEALVAENWLDHPWPSDFRRSTDGSVRIAGFDNPRSVVLIDTYLTALDKAIDGFSPVAAGALRFTGPIDPSTLPSDPKAAMAPNASVQLVDVDDRSTECGKRQWLSLYWRQEAGVWWRPNTLAFMPTMGFPLRPKTRYALVVTDRVTAQDGSRLGVAEDLLEVLGLREATDRTRGLRDAWAPSIEVLEKEGILRDHIVHLTVFTTSDPTMELQAIADHARSREPAPEVDDAWELKEQTPDFDVYEGSYGPVPDYQRGEPPFEVVGGGFEINAEGVPVVQREYHARFSLLVPNAQACPMPAEGYPVVMYAHGTGGDYRSVVGVTGTSLALRCLAAMGVDQIMHGQRLPKRKKMPELLFFNVQNPDAMRSNIRQSAIDEVVRARLIRERGMVIPASQSATAKAIRIARSPVVFFGHSQGGLNGPLFMAVDDTARGGVLSGSGSMITLTLMYKTKPDPNVSALAKMFLLGLSRDEFSEVNAFHPGLSFVQMMGDPVDPIHYVPMMVQRPHQGFEPKSILQTEGVNPDFSGDNYTPPYAIEVQAIATGLPWMAPAIHRVAEASYSGMQPVTIPEHGLSGNLGGGKASGVLAQWRASEVSDGHFVVTQNQAARDQASQFCRNLVDFSQGRIPAP